MKKLLFILLIVCGLNVVAGTYKWKDANGSLHYSDKPAPAGIKAETFKLKSTVTSAAPDAINKNKTTESKVTVLTKDPLLTPLQQKGFEEYLEEKSDKVFAIC